MSRSSLKRKRAPSIHQHFLNAIFFLTHTRKQREKIAFKLRILKFMNSKKRKNERFESMKNKNKNKMKNKMKMKKLQQRIRYCCLVYILTVWVNCRYGNLLFTTTLEQHWNCNCIWNDYKCISFFHAFHIFIERKKKQHIYD